MDPLEIIVSVVDNASGTISEIGGSLDSMSGAADLAMNAFEALSAAAVAAETAMLIAAADSQVATVNLTTSIQDNIDVANAAAKGQGAFADELRYSKTQYQLANDELNKMKAANASVGTVSTESKEKLSRLNETLADQQKQLQILELGHVKSGTATMSHNLEITKLQQSIDHTKQSIADFTQKNADSANTVKYSADQIEMAQQKVDLLKGKYNELNGHMKLVGMTVEDITKKFDPLIDAGIKLGFSNDETTNSLNTLTNVLGDPDEAIKALAVSQDLAREKNMTLSESTNLVVQGINGMGKSLQYSGVFIKDGLSGMDALDAIQQQVKGHAVAYADTLRGQLAVAWSEVGQVMEDLGNIQIPWLTTMLKDFNNLVSIIEEFIKGVPHASDHLKTFLNNMGIGNDTIGKFKTAWDLIVNQFNTFLLPALERLWKAISPLLPYFAEFVGVLIVGAIIVLEDLASIVITLSTVFLDLAQKISDSVVNAIINFVNWIKEALRYVEQLIDKIANSPIGKAIAGATVGAGAVFGAVSNVLHLASGGIVTQPTYALIGEAGPEAVVPLPGSSGYNGGLGGGQNINISVSIRGGMITPDVAKEIGDVMVNQFRRNNKI